ncbi:MAG: acyltransferase [Gemmatimonadaceae bacterium]|nr:acyltransferase [Gemmatimonadaceae bacterium]
MIESATNKSGPAPPQTMALLDFCKGIAIVWIVLVHALHRWFGWQGVHIFIVLAGFTLTYATLNRAEPLAWRQWYLRRAERILPSYWLVAIAGFLVVVLVGTLNPNENNPVSLSLQSWKLLADLTLLRNFSYKAMLADPNSALWFVPLIVSFYLLFPFLYSLISKRDRASGWVKILLIVAGIEFAYRAAAIYWLDGMPVGYGHGFLRFLARPPEPLNRIPETFAFQLWAPFGLAPSRLGEFAIGMVGAFALLRHRSRFENALLSHWSTLAGLALWLLGSALLYTGRWGWVFADFMIAAGLVLWVVNAARFAQRLMPGLFRQMSRLGVWSYHIFLTHLLVGYAHANLYTLWMGSMPLVVLMLVLTVAMIVAAPWVLLRFDRSSFPNRIFRRRVEEPLRP